MSNISGRITALVFFENATGNITNAVFNNSMNMASGRIQLMPALHAGRELNLGAEIFSLHSSNPSDLAKIGTSDICLIGKMYSNNKQMAQSMILANLAAITRFKCRGKKIVAQYCDHLLYKNKQISDFYWDIFRLADYIVYPSDSLLKLSSKYRPSRCKTKVICDPWQLKNCHQPRALSSKKPCQIIWFGNHKNLPYLLKLIPSLMSKTSRSMNYELTILAQPYSLEQFKQFYLQTPNKFNNWLFRLVPWDNTDQPNQLENEIKRAHISLIPSDPEDPRKSGVSHNRLVDSVRGGCITIASPMESYLELSTISLLGNDIPKLLNDALENYDTFKEILINQRTEILERFNPRKNRDTWTNLWKEILDS